MTHATDEREERDSPGGLANASANAGEPEIRWELVAKMRRMIADGTADRAERWWLAEAFLLNEVELAAE